MRTASAVPLAALTLTGCAVPTWHHVQALARAPVCCRSYADFSYEPLPMEVKLTLQRYAPASIHQPQATHSTSQR